MKKILLTAISLIGIFSFGQNKLYYIQIPNEENVPKLNNFNGKISVSHFDENVTKVLSKYNIYNFDKAFPTSVTPFLQTVYILEVDKEGIIEELRNYKTYFPIVEETYRPQLLYTPSDYNYPAGSSNQNQSLDLINIKEAWDYTHGDPDFKIGISDSPIRTTHEDLVGKVTSLTSYTVPDSHGTAVASHAAANTDNAKGIPGTGFNSKVLFKSIWGVPFNELSGILLTLSQNGARVVNASWYIPGCNYSAIDQLVIDEIHNNGTVIVAAAGNGGTCGGPDNYVYPASYNHVLSISTVGHLDVGTTYNNLPVAWRDRIEQVIGNPNTTHQRNDMVDLRAAGFNVLGATADSDSSYGGAWGTSLAAPQVSGVIALLFSVNSCLNPDEIETILKLTSARLDNIPENLPYLGKLGAGRIDAGKATKMAWQMNPINGGEVLIKDRSFDKWNFELINSPETIRIQNESFTQDANVKFKAKRSIILDVDTILKPDLGKSHYLYVEDTNTCYNFNPNTSKITNTDKSLVKKSKLPETSIEVMSIYPIPAKDNLFIRINKELKYGSIKIFDMSNRLVVEKNISITNNTSIDISNLLKGAYYINITDDNSKFHYFKKFTKQ